MELTPPPGGLLESRVERVSVGPHSKATLYVGCPLSFVASPLHSFPTTFSHCPRRDSLETVAPSASHSSRYCPVVVIPRAP